MKNRPSLKRGLPYGWWRSDGFWITVTGIWTGLVGLWFIDQWMSR